MTCLELCGSWWLCPSSTGVLGVVGRAYGRDGLSVTHLDAQRGRLVNDSGEASLTQHSVSPLWEVLHL